MNKKIGMLTITILTLVLVTSPLLGVVEAKRCRRCDKLYFKLEMSGAADTVGGTRTFEPEGTVPPDSEWLHVKGADWIPDLISLQLGVPGDDEYEMVSLVPDDYDSIIDADADFVNQKSYVYVKDIITFADGSSLILIVKDIVDMTTGLSEGKFYGYGTGALKKVKISGESTGYVEDPEGANIRHLTREGKIKCWPTPIIVHFSNAVSKIIYEKIKDNGKIFRITEVTYDITIDVNGVPTYTGTADAKRKVLITPQDVGVGLVIWDKYVFNIDGGTFRGKALIIIEGYIAPTESTPPFYDRAKASAFLRGTGAFRGQTIKAGHDWIEFGPITWWGFLKP